MSSNPACEGGELVVSPVTGAAASFDLALVPETTLLCKTTPIERAVQTASGALEVLAEPDRAQFAMVVTDGRETCDGDAAAAIQLLASSGVLVYTVAFGDFAAPKEHRALNHMACAGRTALDFPEPCVDDGAGSWVAANPGGPALYLAAEDGPALAASMVSIAESVTDCVEG